MPGHIGGRYNISGVKWISGFSQNPDRHGIPRAHAIIILNDPETGVPISVINGTVISAVRTAATSGVAIKYLARSDAASLTIIGTGAQAVQQIRAAIATMPCLKNLTVYGRNINKARRLAQQFEEVLNVRATDALGQAMRYADVIISATTSFEPLIYHGVIPDGATYIAIGGYECELAEVARMHRVIVDNLNDIVHRGLHTIAVLKKDPFWAEKVAVEELKDVITGKSAGRVRASERIFFGSVGMGIQDLAVAKRIYDRALNLGIGKYLPL